MFFTSADEVTQANLAMTRANINNTPESKILFSKLLGAVRTVNPLFKLFKASYEVFEQDANRTKNFRLVFTHGRENRPPNQHARKFNLPQAGNPQQNAEVAGVFHLDGDSENGHRSIAVNYRAEACRNGLEKLTELPSTFRLRVSLCYPLLFLYGEEGSMPFHHTLKITLLTVIILSFLSRPKGGATME